jgi:hypothetical protein
MADQSAQRPVFEPPERCPCDNGRAIGAGLRVSEGLFESIKALIENPNRPELALSELIEALHDAVILLLESAANVVLGVLDLIIGGIELIKDLLNTEISIPLIADLFDLLGAGKLTILNLSSLLLAIPVTAVAKLATGETLFTGGALPLGRSTQAQTWLTVTSAVEERAAKAESISTLRKDLAFTIIATVADTVNHAINTILDVVDVPGKELLEAIIQAPLEISFAKLFEGTSIVLGAISLAVSYPTQFEAGSGALDKESRLEIALWSTRSIALAIDAFVVAFGGHRLRRLNVVTEIGWGLYSAVQPSRFLPPYNAYTSQNRRRHGIIKPPRSNRWQQPQG